MDNIIVSSNWGGIGNRLKSLISIIRLSKYFNKKPILYWPKNVMMGCNFSDLFNYKIDEINEKELEEMKKEKHEFYREWLDNIFSGKKPLIIQSWRFLMLPKEIKNGFAKEYPTLKGNNIDFEFEKIPEDIKQNILKEIETLKPVKKIKEKLEIFNKKNKIEYMVGIHVRRTDFKSSPDGRGNISTDDLFYKRMKELISENPQLKFFLCTDSKETEDDYKKEFKNKIVVYPKRNWDMSSYDASEDSLIDLLLLSKTKHILGTYLSTFTEVAWWFGDCKAKVEIIGNEKTDEKKKVIAILNKEDTGLKGIYKKILIFRERFKTLKKPK